MSDLVLAADLGGTNLRMAVVSCDGNIRHRAQRDTPKAGGSNRIVNDIIEVAADCIGLATNAKVVAFGIAVAATIDFDGGVLKNSPNLPSLDGLHLRGLVSERLGIRTVVDNDGTAAAVGEHWLGASREFENSICVTLGTGVGGGLILNGEPYRGVDGTAGEIGHIGVEREGEKCGCGSRGCVEQYASATAIVRMAEQAMSINKSSILYGKSNLKSSDVYEAGLKGDPLALDVFRQMGSYLGIALADLINILNPEAIVIGGGVAGAWDLFIEYTRTEIKTRSFREPAERVRLARAELGDDAGILGAAKLAFKSKDGTGF